MIFRQSSRNLSILFVVLISFGAQGLLGQSAGTGALTGTLTDPSGASIANATVTLTSNETNQARTTMTGADGSYKFSLLPPGNYKVGFSAAGFKTAEVPSVTINVTETPVLDRRLELGAQTEQVTVEANAEVLQTATSTLGTTVTSQQVVELPLSNRNYTQILGLSAGVASNVNNATAFGKATQDFSVNGADPGQNNYQMDGVAIDNTANSGSSNDSGIYGGIGIPNPDALQEFKIQTSTYDASYGRNPGANVNVVTKSGSNAFHGSLWEFLRNEDLNANSFFDNRDGGGKQQILRQNQFGGSIGGPIKKNKIFFFTDYQETRSLNGIAPSGSSSYFLPSIPAGDRSTQAWQAALGAANCHSPTVFGGLQVACDGSDINPVSLAELQLKLPNGQYYVPSNPGSAGLSVFQSAPAVWNEHQLVANLDWIINSKNTFSARYFYSRDPETAPFNVGPGASLSSNLPGTPIFNLYTNTNAVLKLTTLIGNTMVNEARISGQRNGAFGSDTTPGTPQQVGQTPIVPQITELPPTIIAGAFSMFGTLAPDISPTNQMQVADQISWTHGKQTIRAGFEVEGARWPISFQGLERGFLLYLSFSDWLIGRGGCSDPSCSNPNNNGSPFGNIFQCLFCVRSGPTGIIHNYAEHNYSTFVQDDYKVNPHLTLNLGVRWEFDGTYNDKYGNLTNVWPQLLLSTTPPTTPVATGASLVGYVVPNNFVSHYGNPPAGVQINNNGTPILGHPPLSNFAPRIGFAWQPGDNSRLVIRGGAGMFYDRVAGDRFVHGLEQGYPYSLTVDYGDAPFQDPFSNQNPYLNTPLSFVPRWFNPQTMQGSNINQPFLDPSLHTPLVRQYNLNVQYEFAKNWVLEAGYVGSSGINLVDTYHVFSEALLASPSNPVNGITTNTLANAAGRTPYLGYQNGGLQGTTFDGRSQYNSLQVTVRKQFSHGLTMQAAYTWSKSMSDINAGGSGGAVAGNSNNPGNLAQQWGPSYFARPQRLIINYTYLLPLGNHQGFAGRLTSGWSVSGVTTIQDGSPLTITDANAGTIYGVGANGISRAQMCPGATYQTAQTSGGVESRLGGVSGGPGYLNINSFCAPPTIGDGTDYGNSGVGILLGPGQTNFDFSVLKDTRIVEKHLLQFRAEFFNIFNHPQFANPTNLAVSSAPCSVGAATQPSGCTFGQITSTSVGPRVVQFALKYVF
ncbi:MAG TPA: carboxypeptidase-like regulatory domain-containing protein [Bryobacteraceae bacterium]|nr:carboxypeptidase-like regulatory domain-containing protein [Bryobacteraceae bacterium]